MISFDCENIRISNEAFLRLKISEFLVFFFALLQIGASILQNEIRYYYQDGSKNDSILTLLRINEVSTIANLILIINRYYKELDWHITKGLYTRIDTLITTGSYKLMVLEIFVNLIGPYEFFEGIVIIHKSDVYNVSYRYDLNTMMTAFSFLNIFFFLRALMYFSRFTNPRA